MAVDVTVVIQTVLRPHLVRAIRSVLEQDFPGTIDIQIGVDVDHFGLKNQVIEQINSLETKNRNLFWLDPGYSTSSRRDGVFSNQYGGSLRAVLTLLARSRLVAYLDDDDWYSPDHISLLHNAITGKKWAFSLCWYALSHESRGLAIDYYESVGPGKGIFQKNFGGFVRPSALMIDQLALANMLHLWAFSPLSTGAGADRNIFNFLKRIPEYGETGRPSVYYSLDPADEMHKLRLKYLASQGCNENVSVNEYSMRHWLRSDQIKSN